MKFFLFGKMSRIIISLILHLLMNGQMLANTKTWTGGGGDGLWSNPANWNGNSLPLTTDDVVLDNSVLSTNYTVTLPDISVALKTLTISAGQGKTILLILPASNLNAPGITVTGPGYGIDIENGGIFQNASGIASGESLVIADSVRIGDGGKYIHHTRAAHANNIVRLLSASAGTSQGVFEFDVPRSAYTISASNRIYGTLALSSMAAGGSVTYTCNGSNPLTMNGNLLINQGVTFSVDLGGVNGNILIKGDYIQNGGILNLASGTGNSTVAKIQGNLIQSAGGTITETNSGQPTIEIGGNTQQIVSLAGMIQNEVSLKMNNPAGAILLAPLQLPYKLQLIQGKMTSSSSSLITLKTNCAVIVDSSSANSSYIDGPMRKEGLSASPYFIFPVGKSPSIRWLELKDATGNFTVEYIRSDPKLISNLFGMGIDHMSSEEYWTISTDPLPGSQASVELSFAEPASGGITDLNSLRVAQYSGSIWINDGQLATTGVPGADGSIVSNALSGITNENFFTIGSSLHLENPLPVKLISFSGINENNFTTLNWQIDRSAEADHFQIFSSNDAKDFHQVGELDAMPNSMVYQWKSSRTDQLMRFYKIRVVEKTGMAWFSNAIELDIHSIHAGHMKLWPTLVESTLHFEIDEAEENMIALSILGMDGKTLDRIRWALYKGRNTMNLPVGKFASGTYLLAGYDQKGKKFLEKFIRK